MWSVVTESPTMTRQRAPEKSSTRDGSAAIRSKYGGWRTYVDAGSHAKRSPSGMSSARQLSSPVKTSAYVRVNISPRTDSVIVVSISSALGQMSRR